MFHRNSSSKDGLRGYCKACISAQQSTKEYKEAKRERRNTPEQKAKIAAYNALPKCVAKRAAISEKPETKARKREIARTPEARAKRAERIKTPEYKARRAAFMERYKSSAKYKENARNSSRRRYARAKGAEGSYTKEDIDRLMFAQKGRCACCRSSIKAGYHVDHIKPIALGGSNWPHNIQLLCQPCNQQKSATHPIDFMQKRGFLL